MFGVLFNGAACLVGGLIGLLFKRGIPKNITSTINQAMGIVVIIIGLNGVLTNMLTVKSDGSLISSGELLLAVSMAIGSFIGGIIRLDDRLNNFSSTIEKHFRMDGFTEGFIASSTIFCIGAMSIIGSINSGLTGDHSILITKSIIDFVTAILLASSLGIGVMFSFIPVVLYQGTICLLAGVLNNVLTGELLVHVCMVGYALIICVGLNLFTNLKIKVVNMLPSILIPAAYHMLLKLIDSVN